MVNFKIWFFVSIWQEPISRNSQVRSNHFWNFNQIFHFDIGFIWYSFVTMSAEKSGKFGNVFLLKSSWILVTDFLGVILFFLHIVKLRYAGTALPRQALYRAIRISFPMSLSSSENQLLPCATLPLTPPWKLIQNLPSNIQVSLLKYYNFAYTYPEIRLPLPAVLSFYHSALIRMR